ATSRRSSDAERDLVYALPAPRPRTLVVDAAGSGDFRTITGALFRARSGDTITIKTGIYAESVVLQPGVKIRGEGKALVRIFSELPWLLRAAHADISSLTIDGSGLDLNDAEVSLEDCELIVAE